MSPQPVVSPLTQRMYDYLLTAGHGVGDEGENWALLRWCQGWADVLEDIYRVVKKNKTSGKEGWAAAADPDEAFDLTMPFLAQMVGTNLKTGASETEWRNTIKDVAGLYQGSPKAIAGELQKLSWLLGLKRIYLNERDTSNYHFGVGFDPADVTRFDFSENFDTNTAAAIAKWTPQTGLGGMPVVSDGGVGHSGAHCLDIVTLGVGDGVIRDLGTPVEPGDRIDMTVWTKVIGATTNLRVELGNLDEGDVDSHDYNQTVASGWVQRFLSYTCTNDGQLKMRVTNRDVAFREIQVDDVLTTYDNFLPASARADVAAAMKLQKPLGHLYTQRVIDFGEWSYFTLQALVYTRNVDGFIVEDPPFANYTELNAAYATYTDLNNNNPI